MRGHHGTGSKDFLQATLGAGGRGKGIEVILKAGSGCGAGLVNPHNSLLHSDRRNTSATCRATLPWRPEVTMQFLSALQVAHQEHPPDRSKTPDTWSCNLFSTTKS